MQMQAKQLFEQFDHLLEQESMSVSDNINSRRNMVIIKLWYFLEIKLAPIKLW